MLPTVVDRCIFFFLRFYSWRGCGCGWKEIGHKFKRLVRPQTIDGRMHKGEKLKRPHITIAVPENEGQQKVEEKKSKEKGSQRTNRTGRNKEKRNMGEKKSEHPTLFAPDQTKPNQTRPARKRAHPMGSHPPRWMWMDGRYSTHTKKTLWVKVYMQWVQSVKLPFIPFIQTRPCLT